MIFPPKVHKGMNTSLRGGMADRFIRESLENEINPKWFIKLSRYQLKIFFALFKFLAVTKNVLAVQIFGMLKNLDIALTLEEVECVIKEFHKEHKRIDFYHLLFALCNTNDYLQRLKHDAELRKNQMHETYTKRQLLFYTITSLAMFPEYPIEPIYHRLKTKYSSHPLHQFLICQRMQGLPPRLARKRELEMIEEIAKWKKKILSPYTDIPPVPSEPPLVYLQRKRKEAIRKDKFLGNIPSPICIKEEKSYKRRKEAVVRRDSDAEDTCNLIDKIVNRTYKDKPKPSRRIKPNDWVQHTMFRLLAPLPLIPVPKAQLEAMKKYHVSVYQLPGTYDKIKREISKYYNKLQNTLMESSHEHWITTYTNAFESQKRKQQFSKVRLKGLPPRLARKRELEMIEEIAKWKKKILSPYTDIPPVPSEPPLVYLQRKRKEAIRKDKFLGNIPSPICIKEEKSYKRRKEAVVRRDSDAEDTCNLIDKIVNRTYKDKPKPSRRIKPNDWVQHTMFRLLAPLPLIPVPKAQLEAMKKYHVSVYQLPGTYDKIKREISKYYNKLQNTLMESSHEHWITTYTNAFESQKRKQQFSKVRLK
ncbi:uncharacterized protein LOC111639891, partial [Centruroides sculpturatus]|uniref:uncharacterized protein LOC111639891 n=1 Tax=Centruroides sculpturatus TaxID=218467 RepID=UPI000C6E438C